MTEIGFFCLTRNGHFSPALTQAYNAIEESPRVRELKTGKLTDAETYIVEKKMFYVTDFGVGFVSCCIDEDK